MSRTRTSITELQKQRDELQSLIECHSRLEFYGDDIHTAKVHRARMDTRLNKLHTQIAATIDEPHKAAGSHDDPVRYTHTANTPKGRRAENKANWDAAEQDAKAGKVLCLSDLMCSGEAVHLDQMEGNE